MTTPTAPDGDYVSPSMIEAACGHDPHKAATARRVTGCWRVAWMGNGPKCVTHDRPWDTCQWRDAVRTAEATR